MKLQFITPWLLCIGLALPLTGCTSIQGLTYFTTTGTANNPTGPTFHQGKLSHYELSPSQPVLIHEPADLSIVIRDQRDFYTMGPLIFPIVPIFPINWFGDDPQLTIHINDDGQQLLTNATLHIRPIDGAKKTEAISPTSIKIIDNGLTATFAMPVKELNAFELTLQRVQHQQRPFSLRLYKNSAVVPGVHNFL